ncbi:hypothetical protein BD560DRAFT_422830 [Blakeslea trispora]|nr:hypothetical protein BD560DRAFT_422830 [Blakeslea trispora]
MCSEYFIFASLALHKICLILGFLSVQSIFGNDITLVIQTELKNKCKFTKIILDLMANTKTLLFHLISILPVQQDQENAFIYSANASVNALILSIKVVLRKSKEYLWYLLNAAFSIERYGAHLL